MATARRDGLRRCKKISDPLLNSGHRLPRNLVAPFPPWGAPSPLGSREISGGTHSREVCPRGVGGPPGELLKQWSGGWTTAEGEEKMSTAPTARETWVLEVAVMDIVAATPPTWVWCDRW